MAGRPEQPHNVAALVLSGVILVALAAAISSTWVHDGDGTCRALYNPNLARGGCARKLMPTALTAAVLVGAAVLLWDTARRAARRPSRGPLSWWPSGSSLSAACSGRGSSETDSTLPVNPPEQHRLLLRLLPLPPLPVQLPRPPKCYRFPLPPSGFHLGRASCSDSSPPDNSRGGRS